ncbi:MAG: UDP-N-acetylglucosamine--N-acetylmuramyl-(pentapeptide) pyrophosphoryl-undecaprenol N-acetylglucosamine transferase [Oscillospiraceae bacterium]|jgi:UDP-N-acetylglucosamine--N-acetylmuramyl-(pentapeptide) pyrophosphoryl-undecaprenol N-acetylglucosamine transferase|nr:UDP-N-acetylglucosamine--N-acetylmuramyl-(pentapeptide) pyrophosphoryl-undecaprenol N-acetylglucosamine transferase [Oscillospiraceae bacterium]
MTYLFVCSGTAGHINPALGIADEIKKRLPEANVVFIGANREMENRLIKAAGYELINIKMTGVKRGIKPKDIIYNIKTVKNVVFARSKAREILNKLKPVAVIGTGGYICYPILREAVRLKIKTFLHEQNAASGMTTKALCSHVDIIMTAFPNSEEQYKKAKHVIFTGTPLRKDFSEEITTETTHKTYDKPLVLSFWGSLGAEKMNIMMEEFVELNNKEKKFYHIHATGNSGEALRNKTNKPTTDVRKYIDNMAEVMKSADIALCRGGATTLAEVTALGKPSVIVPSPYVPDNVQLRNAEKLQSIGGAEVILEKECTGGILYNTVTTLLSDNVKLQRMSEALKKIAMPDAAKEIVDIILGDT